MSAFKAGDRVRLPGKLVSYPGETETTITCVWHAEGKPDLYELEDGSYRRLDELQHAPEPVREPKAGEVWASAAGNAYLKTDDKGFNAPWVSLRDGWRYASIGGIGLTFLAPDLAAYFKDRSC